MWNLVTSSLDRNLINLRCACGTCAETKKSARLHERTAMLELGLVMYSLCFTKRGRPVCSVTVRSLWLSIRRFKSINSVLWFTHHKNYMADSKNNTDKILGMKGLISLTSFQTLFLAWISRFSKMWTSFLPFVLALHLEDQFCAVDKQIIIIILSNISIRKI